MRPEPQTTLPLIERVERALILVAYLIEVDGDAYVPTYERLEAELERLHRKESTKERARRLLAPYTLRLPRVELPYRDGLQASQAYITAQANADKASGSS